MATEKAELKPPTNPKQTPETAGPKGENPQYERSQITKPKKLDFLNGFCFFLDKIENIDDFQNCQGIYYK